MNARAPSIEGRKFGRWTVIRQGEKRKTNQHWICKCICGTERSVAIGNLRSGKSVSCGCFQAERASEVSKKHGMIGHPIYRSWCSIKSRCFNQNDEDFRHYGGRGITVHPAWVMDFWSFWDANAAGWRPGLSIDRIDVDGNYEPGNVRWSNQVAQVRNRRSTVMIESPWGKIPLAEAAERSGVKYEILIQRVRKGFMTERLFDAVDGRQK